MSPSSRSRLYPFLHSTTGTDPSLSNSCLRPCRFMLSLSPNGLQPITRTTQARYIFWQPHVIQTQDSYLVGAGGGSCFLGRSFLTGGRSKCMPHCSHT